MHFCFLNHVYKWMGHLLHKESTPQVYIYIYIYIYIYVCVCVCVCVCVGMDITICAILLAATAHSCLLWFYFTIPMFVLASSPSQALLCFFLLSCSPPPPPPPPIKNNNPAIKGLNVDQNLRAQKLPPPVWKYALLHDLFRGCT